MFRLRTYLRNKDMLDTLDVAYDWAMHASYESKLQEKGLEPMSIKGVILENDLQRPVKAEESSYHDFYYDSQMKRVKREHAETSLSLAKERTIKKIPLVEHYLQTLSEVTNTKLVMRHSLHTRHKKISQPRLFGCEAVQKWKIFKKKDESNYAMVA